MHILSMILLMLLFESSIYYYAMYTPISVLGSNSQGSSATKLCQISDLGVLQIISQHYDASLQPPID